MKLIKLIGSKQDMEVLGRVLACYNKAPHRVTARLIRDLSLIRSKEGLIITLNHIKTHGLEPQVLG